MHSEALNFTTPMIINQRVIVNNTPWDWDSSLKCRCLRERWVLRPSILEGGMNGSKDPPTIKFSIFFSLSLFKIASREGKMFKLLFAFFITAHICRDPVPVPVLMTVKTLFAPRKLRRSSALFSPHLCMARSIFRSCILLPYSLDFSTWAEDTKLYSSSPFFFSPLQRLIIS